MGNGDSSIKQEIQSGDFLASRVSFKSEYAKHLPFGKLSSRLVVAIVLSYVDYREEVIL